MANRVRSRRQLEVSLALGAGGRAGTARGDGDHGDGHDRDRGRGGGRNRGGARSSPRDRCAVGCCGGGVRARARTRRYSRPRQVSAASPVVYLDYQESSLATGRPVRALEDAA